MRRKNVIIKEAEEQAKQIVEEATEQAKQIITEAETQAAEIIKGKSRTRKRRFSK